MTGFIYGLCNTDEYPWLWYSSLIAIFVFPIINELILCLKGKLCKGRVVKINQTWYESLQQCIPIVYTPGYNIHAFGAEKLHPFDASKYRRVYADLLESGSIQL